MWWEGAVWGCSGRSGGLLTLAPRGQLSSFQLGKLDTGHGGRAFTLPNLSREPTFPAQPWQQGFSVTPKAMKSDIPSDTRVCEAQRDPESRVTICPGRGRPCVWVGGLVCQASVHPRTPQPWPQSHLWGSHLQHPHQSHHGGIHGDSCLVPVDGF